MTLEINSIIMVSTVSERRRCELKADVQISLKAARVNANMTILEASKSIGIGKDTLIKWEKDSGLVNPNRQQEISKTYGIPIDCIFFGTR